MADKVHCIRKTLRLMPEEAKMLAKKACDNGMNEAEYIRLLISQKPNDYPEVRKILKELINEVNRIGININQIVFNNNARLYSKEDKGKAEHDQGEVQGVAVCRAGAKTEVCGILQRDIQ